MSSTQRKIKRNKNQQENKKLNKIIARKVKQFNNIPDQCLACKAPFDKRSKEHASTWKVVVSDSGVNLTCPDCENWHEIAHAAALVKAGLDPNVEMKKDEERQ
jgi:hypothetical protein